MTLLERAIEAGFISKFLESYNTVQVQEILAKLQHFEQLKDKLE